MKGTQGGRIAISRILDKMKSRGRWAVLFAVVSVGLIVWHASLRVETGAASGTTIEGEVHSVLPERDTLRLATFNIHGCKGADRRRDVGRVAKCLAGFDLVGLNEVRGSGLWAPENQARLLAQRLDRAWLFAPASRRWYHSEFGNGLLTTLPVRFWQRIPLSGWTDSGQRNVLLVVLECGGKPIRVLITHVTQRDDRERAHQLASVSELFMALEKPAVLMGDLNSTSDDPQIRRLLATRGVRDPIGQFVASPPRWPNRLDSRPGARLRRCGRSRRGSVGSSAVLGGAGDACPIGGGGPRFTCVWLPRILEFKDDSQLA